MVNKSKWNAVQLKELVKHNCCKR